jgi:hypothetical protein
VRLDCGRHIFGQLELLSMHGLLLQCTENTTALDSSTRGQIYLYLESEGLVTLPVHALHEHSRANGCSLKLQLADFDAPMRFKWREVLKQFAYFSHQESNTLIPIKSPLVAQHLPVKSNLPSLDV